MAIISMRALLETGVHFGHRTRRWHPKMRPFIFTARNGIHIIDLQQTLLLLEDIYEMVRDEVAKGKTVLFVGTKRQAQECIALEAARAGQPYINQRWLGGTLTNWQTIRRRIQHLETLERRRDEGEFELLKKRERLNIEREINKLNMRLGGIRKMGTLPDMLFVVDIKYEETAILEAVKLDIPVIAMVDTNVDPSPVTYPIPSNDDAIRAIQLITSKIADACLEGQAIQKDDIDSEVTDFQGYKFDEDMDEMHERSDEDLLGASTLAKISEAKAEDEIKAEVAASEAEAAAAATASEIVAEEEVTSGEEVVEVLPAASE